ncbi:hypothetical protein [Streptomyces sp. C]|uniref:hypothetical protein n=1 Tax=Streptomyces sp. C TaxID=253839 RepID=UPI0001B566FB|nr:hypothetical protein [Streptomyces sp. C]EFL13254.1 predicted protein [Streptomyces sp. C]
MTTSNPEQEQGRWDRFRSWSWSRFPTARRTRPCQWCGRPVLQPFPGAAKTTCSAGHWLRDVRGDFWRKLWNSL